MHTSINLSNDPWTLSAFSDAAALRRFYEGYGCDGVELILCGEDFEDKLAPGTVRGLHLMFTVEWICLWREEFAYMDAEFGSRAAWQEFYGAKNAAEWLALYKRELDMAKALEVEYVVFHVCDNCMDEFFTFQSRRSSAEIVDESCAFLNEAFRGGDYPFALLLENLWLGGMDLTDPAMTARALDGLEHPNKGIMLDTGHLMVTNPALRSSEEACRYIRQVVDRHGPLVSAFRGMHLQCSLSGEYLQTRCPLAPPRGGTYLERYAEATGHLKQVDPHRPFLGRDVPALIEHIAPEWLVYELTHATHEEWEEKLEAQYRVFHPHKEEETAHAP